MLYPFMTLPDETEIVHSEILIINDKENVKVYIERQLMVVLLLLLVGFQNINGKI